MPTAEQPARIAEFDDLFRAGLRGLTRLAPTRLRLLLDPAAEARVRDLAAREAQCCAFFGFTVTAGSPVQLDIAVPSEYVAVLDALAARARASAGALP